jgi:hypothetical protein
MPSSSMSSEGTMIGGLSATIPADSLQVRIARRIQYLERRIEWCREEIARAQVDSAGTGAGLPEHACRNEIDRCTRSIATLIVIRDHVGEDQRQRGAA